MTALKMPRQITDDLLEVCDTLRNHEPKGEFDIPLANEVELVVRLARAGTLHMDVLPTLVNFDTAALLVLLYDPAHSPAKRVREWLLSIGYVPPTKRK